MAEAARRDLYLPGPVVIITDSRGYGLQADIDIIIQREGLEVNIQVFVWKGCGIAAAVKKTSKQLIWMAPSLVLIFAGICDVTDLNRETWQISLQDENPDETIMRYEGLMDTVRHHLTIFLTERSFKVVFCELIGADMARYNKMDHAHHQQDQLDATIIGINTKIAAFNKENCMPTPWTAKTVHHNKKSRTKVARYQKLGPDGLHLGDELREKLAGVMVNYVTKYSGQAK